MHILFVGGGTLGPVTPLLATMRALKKIAPDTTFSWIGTPSGPERILVEKEGIGFRALPSAKLPRYPSIQWLTFPFDWARVRSLAKQMVKDLKPDVVVGVGGFTAVPVMLAATKLGIPCVTHQLDVVPGLSNRRIAEHCASVTTSFEYEKAPFGTHVNDEQIATPTRFFIEHLPTKKKAMEEFGFDPAKPVILVFGGGTGAQALNEMVWRTKDQWLAFTQLIHVTGIGKDSQKDERAGLYVVKPFLDVQMLSAYAAADLIISRAGVGSLSEIAALKKAAIIIPMPKSHQEYNAKAFEERGACVAAHQESATFDDDVLSAARLLLNDEEERKIMGEQAHAFLPTDDGTAFAKRILRASQTPH